MGYDSHQPVSAGHTMALSAGLLPEQHEACAQIQEIFLQLHKLADRIRTRSFASARADGQGCSARLMAEYMGPMNLLGIFSSMEGRGSECTDGRAPVSH